MTSDDQWERAARALNGAKSAAIFCHVSPDGDALGSMLGLGLYLQRQGKQVWMSWGSEEVVVPPQYEFLPGLDRVSPPGDLPTTFEMCVATDCADIERLGLLAERFNSAAASVNIDHHKTNEGFGRINLVEPSASSSSELMYRLMAKMGAVLNAHEATCLYTGIVTDTGRFQYSNTTPETLRAAATLREAGVNHELVARSVFESASFEYLQLVGVVMSRAQLKDGVVSSWLAQADLNGVGLDETEHLIDVLRAIRNVRMAILIKEKPSGGWKASLRASGGEVDVAVIAKSFGGGGHARAAGFDASGTPSEIIPAIMQRLPKHSDA